MVDSPHHLPPNKQFVTLAYAPFQQGFWLRVQQVMSRIAKQYPVYYINPPEALMPGVLKPCRWGWYAGRGRIVSRYIDQLSLYTPIEPVPFRHRFKWTRPLNEFFLTHSTKRYARIHKVNNPILWMGIGHFRYRMENVFGEALTVYDVQDKHGAKSRYISDATTRLVRDYEEYASRRADVLFTTHPELKNDLEKCNNNIHVIPNGVEAELLEELKYKDNEIPSDISEIPRPRLGYLGSIRPKIDFSCLLHLAQARPSYHIVLIGQNVLNDLLSVPIFEQLLMQPNVHYLGPRPRESTAQYVNAFDVAVYPLMRNDYCAYMDPNKVVLYLAAALPVVMLKQRLPLVHEQFINVAECYEDFVEKVDGAVNAPDHIMVEKGRRHAETLSWESLVEKMLSIIGETYYRKYNK